MFGALLSSSPGEKKDHLFSSSKRKKGSKSRGFPFALTEQQGEKKKKKGDRAWRP